MIRYVREVKAGVHQPVTVADNYVWWRDYGAALAREVDFITMHTYPLWERKDIDEGLSFTIENYESVRAAHPRQTDRDRRGGLGHVHRGQPARPTRRRRTQTDSATTTS